LADDSERDDDEDMMMTRTTFAAATGRHLGRISKDPGRLLQANNL